MSADELYAWEVAHLPWIMFHVVGPIMGAATVLGAGLAGLRWRQGYRDAHRDQWRNMGFDSDDPAC